MRALDPFAEPPVAFEDLWDYAYVLAVGQGTVPRPKSPLWSIISP
jgi:hypothetical protein